MNIENSNRIFLGSPFLIAPSRLLVSLVLLLAGVCSFAQPAISWDQRFGSSNYEEMRDIVPTADGNFIVGGHTSSDPGDDVTEIKRGSNDYWVVKFDPLGNKIWDKKFGAERSENITGLTALSDGNFIVYGASASDNQFDKTDPSFGGYGWANDYWIVKFDTDGNKIWDKAYGGDNFDFLWDVEETADGGLILGGMSQSPVSTVKSEGNLGNWDMWVIKTDAFGNRQWDRVFGGVDSDMCFSVAQAADGGFYAGGLSRSGISPTKSSGNLGSTDYYLVKMDASGNYQWDQTYGGTDDDQLRDLIVANDGNLLLAGWSGSPSDATKSAPNYGMLDYYLIKVNTFGNKIWERSFGGTDEDRAWMVRENSKNIIAIAGESNSPISGTKTALQNGGKDLWMTYLDQSGNTLQDQSFGGAASDNGASFLFTADHGVLIGGNSSSGISGDRTWPSYGAVDNWILKLDCKLTIPDISNASICTGDDFNVNVTTPFACDYIWDDGHTNPIRTLSPTSTSNYTVTVTDFNGCTDEETFSILVSPLPTVDLGGDASFCVGDSLELNANNPGLNFIWSTSATTQSIYVSSSNTYAVTVSDFIGCSAEDQVIITAMTAPVFDLGPDQMICPNTDALLDPGILGQTYNWSTLENTPTITVSAAGTYYLTVTNADNCSSVDSVTVGFLATPMVDLGNDTTFCIGATLDLNAQNPGLSYHWSTAEISQIITVSTPNTYSVIVTDGNNCTATDEIVIDNYALPMVDLGNDQAVCSGDSLLLDAENSGATFNWSTTATDQMIYVQNAGMYSVTVTDANNCSAEDDFELSLNAAPVFDLGSDQMICPNTDALLDPGILGQTYNWSTLENTPTITVNAAGTYYLTVTNADNCSSVDSVTVGFLAAPMVDLGNDTTFCIGATLDLNAQNPGLNYNWSTAEISQIITVSTPNTYSVIVTDGNNCTATDEIVIDNYALPMVDLGNDQAVCPGDSLLLDAENSGATFNWSTTATEQMIYVQNAGIYSVTVTDANNCSAEDDLELSLNAAPVFDLGPDQMICPNTDALLDPGILGQTYNWSTLENTPTITVNAAGTYYLTVTNADNCSSMDSVTIDFFIPPTVDLGNDTTFCIGATLDLNAQNPGLSYNWSTAEISQIITVSTPNTYSVIVTDGNNCTATDEIVIDNYALPMVDLGNDQAVCPGDSLLLDAENSGATFNWSTTATEQMIYVQNAGIYSVTVTDANNCSAEDDLELSLNAAPVFDLGPDQMICPNTDALLDPGILGQTYNWSTLENTPTITVNAAGTYYLTVTNADNCSSVDSITVGFLAAPMVDLGNDTTFCVGATLDLNAQNPGLSYNWSTAEISQIITVSTPNTYSVIVTDGNNCTATDEIVIDNYALPMVDLGNDQAVCPGDSLLLDAENSGATFNWSTTATDQMIYVQNAGMYSVTVTDANNCSAEDDLELSLNTAPVFDLGPDQMICPNTNALLDPGILGQTYNWSTLENTPTITVNAAGTYYLTVTNADNCSSVDSVTVGFLAAPMVDLGNDTTFCIGATLDLNAQNPGLSYNWSTTEITQTITVSTPNTYSVIVTDGNNCTATDEIVIDNYALPMVDLGVDQDICTGDSIELMPASLANSYLWSTLESTPAITIFNGGNYSLTVTDSNNCSNSDDIIIAENQIASTAVDSAICEGEGIFVNSNLVFTAGIYTDSLLTFQGCDSLVTINLNILPLDSVYLEDYACNPQDTGLFITQDFNAMGCDSFTFTTIYLSPSDITNGMASTCDPALVGLDTIFSTNQFNCDSLHIIETILLPSDTTFVPDQSCHIDEVGLDTMTFAGQFCDSTVIIETIFIEPDTFYVNQNTCLPDAVGIEVFTDPNSFGCDSITILTTVLSPMDTLYSQEFTCDQNQIGFDTTYLTGTICDTTLITEFILNIIPPVIINQGSCDPAEVGMDTVVVQTSLGCDSTTYIITDFIQGDTLFNQEFTCDQNQIGFDTTYLIGTICDTTVITEFVLNIIPPVTINQGSCDPAEVGMDTVVVQTSLGCDSTTFIITDFIQGDTLFNQEFTCDQNQIGFDTTYLIGTICDTTVITEFILNIIPPVTINQGSCDPAEVGMDTVVVQTSLGCDSTTYIITDLILGDTLFNQEFTCDQNQIGFDTTYLIGTICDTTVITEFVLNIIPPVTINQGSCDPTEVGMDTVVVQTSLGCDSTTYIITDLILRDTLFNQEFTCDQNQIGFDTTYLIGTICDTTVITEFVLNIIPPVTINQGSCDLAEVGMDTVVVQTSSGCDSTTYIITDLILGDTLFNQEFTCDQNQIGFDTTYLAGTVCDTTVITEFILNIILPVTINQNSCNPLEVGIDTILVQTALGCDSTTYIITDLTPLEVITAIGYTCDPSESGLDTTIIAGSICDTLLVTDYQLATPSQQLFTDQTCDPNQVGFDTLVFNSQFGCDSLIIIQTVLTICDIDTMYFNSCDPIDVGTQIDTVVGQNSGLIILVNITSLVDADIININEIVCDQDLAGIDSIPGINSFGCDSLTIINYEFNFADTLFQMSYSCDPDEIGISEEILDTGPCDTLLIINTQWYDCTPIEINLETCDLDSVGTFIDTIPNQFNLDSIIITNIMLSPPDTMYSESGSCNPQDTGIVITQLQTLGDCETIMIEHVSLLASNFEEITAVSCDPIDWIDTMMVYMNQFGCDSTIHLQILPAAPITTFLPNTTCDPSDVGLDTLAQLISFEGCDSLVIEETVLLELESEFILNEIICYGDQGGIFIDPILGTAPYLYSIDDGPLQENAYFGNLESGTYNVLVEDAEGCLEIATIHLPGVTETAVQLTDDVTIDLGEEVYIQAVTNMTVDSFFWNTTTPLTCDDCFTPTAAPLSTAQVEITVIDDQGCTSTDRMTIIVRKDKGLYIPNVFSPNDDGQNDHFLVYAAPSVARVDKLQIFDRWGALVFEANDPQPGNTADGWDGSFRGRKLNPAVFVYTLEVTYIDGRTERLSGDLTLIR